MYKNNPFREYLSSQTPKLPKIIPLRNNPRAVRRANFINPKSLPFHKNARRDACVGVSPHRHSAALRGLSRTRGCPRVPPVAKVRRSFRLRPCGATPRQDGTRNRRLRRGTKPRRVAGCSRRVEPRVKPVGHHPYIPPVSA